MAKKEKDRQGAGQSTDKQETGQRPDKIVTKYDLKVQRRKEAREKELRDRRIGRIVGILVAAALVCIAVSFPVRTWLTLNDTYIQVNGEKITRVEYDYNYHIVSSNFISQYYSMYLYYFGIDLTGDLSSQVYSGSLTWKDHFDELTVEHLAQSKSLLKQAREEGFTYDAAEEYEAYMDSLKEAAEESGTSVKNYIRQLYGSYATESRVKPYVEEAMYIMAYNEVLQERLMPSQEEIQEYYDNNSAGYDSVDYYVLSVDAQLPTEPTELADPAEDEEDSDSGADEAEGEDSGESETTPYEPSEAEIAAAMETAKADAEKAEGSIKTQGELNTNVKRSGVTYLLQEWLFDGERKAGDTTVIEDSTNHRYYVVGFEKRYLDDARSADVRIVMTVEDNGQAILDEWKNGGATEEGFAEIYDKYRDPSLTYVEGGLYEGLTASGVPADLSEWIFDSERKKGDTAVITAGDSEYTYVLYYVGQGEEEWSLSIRNLLLNEKMQDYLDELVQNADIQDPKNNLNYMSILKEEAAAQQDQSGESGEDESGDDAGNEGSDENESGDDAGNEGSNENESGDDAESGESGEN